MKSNFKREKMKRDYVDDLLNVSKALYDIWEKHSIPSGNIADILGSKTRYEAENIYQAINMLLNLSNIIRNNVILASKKGEEK